jgi:hypothetical protein
LYTALEIAGRLGFQGFEGYTVSNRYHRLGHSGYFERRQRVPYDGFMRRWWIPLLLAELPVSDKDRRPDNPPFSDRLIRLMGENAARVTFGIYALLIAAVLSPGLYFWKQEQTAKAMSSSN